MSDDDNASKEDINTYGYFIKMKGLKSVDPFDLEKYNKATFEFYAKNTFICIVLVGNYQIMRSLNIFNLAQHSNMKFIIPAVIATFGHSIIYGRDYHKLINELDTKYYDLYMKFKDDLLK